MSEHLRPSDDQKKRQPEIGSGLTNASGSLDMGRLSRQYERMLGRPLTEQDVRDLVRVLGRVMGIND